MRLIKLGIGSVDPFFLGAVAAGTLAGGPVGDRIGFNGAHTAGDRACATAGR